MGGGSINGRFRVGQKRLSSGRGDFAKSPEQSLGSCGRLLVKMQLRPRAHAQSTALCVSGKWPAVLWGGPAGIPVRT